MDLTNLCAELRNYFETKKRFGTFTISGGSISPSDFLQDGQYFRIVGSVFNDGVHRHPAHDLTDETFDGAVWAMAVPPAVIELLQKIQEFEAAAANTPTAYISESFGGYSYTKATDENGLPVGWRSVFKNELKRWRKQ